MVRLAARPSTARAAVRRWRTHVANTRRLRAEGYAWRRSGAHHLLLSRSCHAHVDPGPTALDLRASSGRSILDDHDLPRLIGDHVRMHGGDRVQRIPPEQDPSFDGSGHARLGDERRDDARLLRGLILLQPRGVAPFFRALRRH